MSDIPYATIHEKLHGIIRALNALGAMTTGSCYGMQDEDGNLTDDWYVEFELPRNADGWAILTSVVQRLRHILPMIQVWPTARDTVHFHLYGGAHELRPIEEALA